MIGPLHLLPVTGRPVPTARRHRDRARGSAAIEVVLLAPILVGTAMFTLACGQLAAARIEADGAAHAAARAASLEHTAAAAGAAATTAAEASLSGHCTDATVATEADLDPGGTVTVTLTCSAEADFPGLAGRTITATAASPVDPWRGEAP